MKKNILLTCLGNSLALEIINDFRRREDVELFVADMNSHSKARFLTPNFIPVLPAEDPRFCSDLLEKAKAHDIRMIIPGGDEEALVLMQTKALFEKNGILVAVQDAQLLSPFQSKSNMYDYLSQKGFVLPRYAHFRTKEEFFGALDKFEYPRKPLLVKPNASRGGRGVTILNEKFYSNRDDLPFLDKRLFSDCVDGQTEFLLMEYLEGSVFDVDVLKYSNEKKFFGIRKRFHNITKNFSGNRFEDNEAVLAFTKKIFDVFPTRYLLDYDILVQENGEPCLLEINPRPSGSTISYLPFSINLYYILAKSYLDNVHLEIENLDQKEAFVFYKMVKGNS